MAIDKTDKQIIRELQKDARISNSDLAERVNLSPTPCLRRVRRLENEGYIKAYSASLDKAKMGLTISALVFVQLTLNSTSNAREFERAISHIRRVQDCYVLTGRFDYMLTVVAKDLLDYESLVKDELANIPYVKTIESTIVLNHIQVNSALPI